MLRRQLGLGFLTLLAGACSSPTSSTQGSEHPTSGCPDQLFCDDFESAMPGSAPVAPWSLNAGAGAEITVTSDRAASGTKAVRLVAPAKAAAFLELAGAPVFPRADNAFFGRARFYFDSAPTTEQPSVHWTFLQASGVRADDGHHAEYRYGGQKALYDAQDAFIGNQLMANYETPDFYDGSGAPGSDCWHHAQARVVPLQRWVCVEWHFDGPSNTMELWLDGAPAEDLTVHGTGQGCVHQPANYTWTAPNFERVSLGWQGYQADETRTVYIDDVAIADHRITCE